MAAFEASEGCRLRASVLYTASVPQIMKVSAASTTLPWA